MPRVFSPASPTVEPPRTQPNLVLGILGAVVGGFIGMMIWFWLIKTTEREFGFVAWGVGVLCGLGARVLGRAGSPALGAVAATCALVAIVGGEYLFAADFVKTKLGPLKELMEGAKGAMVQSAGEEYDKMAKYAKDALTANTDEEIRALYEKLNEERPSAEDLKDFKQETIPQMKDIASGKLTREQFIKNITGELQKLDTRAHWEMFKATFDVFTIIFLLLGITTAFKIGSG